MLQICDWRCPKILVVEFWKLHLVIVAVKVSDESIPTLDCKVIILSQISVRNNLAYMHVWEATFYCVSYHRAFLGQLFRARHRVNFFESVT